MISAHTLITKLKTLFADGMSEEAAIVYHNAPEYAEAEQDSTMTAGLLLDYLTDIEAASHEDHTFAVRTRHQTVDQALSITEVWHRGGLLNVLVDRTPLMNPRLAHVITIDWRSEDEENVDPSNTLAPLVEKILNDMTPVGATLATYVKAGKDVPIEAAAKLLQQVALVGRNLAALNSDLALGFTPGTTAQHLNEVHRATSEIANLNVQSDNVPAVDAIQQLLRSFISKHAGY